jgi:hypothetical protein
MQRHALNLQPIAPLPEFCRTIQFARFNQVGHSCAARAGAASIWRPIWRQVAESTFPLPLAKLCKIGKVFNKVW